MKFRELMHWDWNFGFWTAYVCWRWKKGSWQRKAAFAELDRLQEASGVAYYELTKDNQRGFDETTEWLRKRDEARKCGCKVCMMMYR